MEVEPDRKNGTQQFGRRWMRGSAVALPHFALRLYVGKEAGFEVASRRRSHACADTARRHAMLNS